MSYSGFPPQQSSYAPAIPVGSLLDNRYRVLQVLGQGGFGRTYKAADSHRFDEICVLKEFAPQVNSSSGLAMAQDLFQREAGVLYRLNHPQIPRFRELRQFDFNGFSYGVLIQDFIEGPTYRSLLNQKRQQKDHQPGAPNGLSVDSVLFLLKQLLPVLTYLHQHGVIHRDISPGNLILRQSDGLPVLIDFGAVKKIVATVISQMSGLPGESPAGQSPSVVRVTPGTCIGKQGFAPPEQFQSGQAFPHSDLYALGATALTLLSGSEPGELINPHNLEWQLPACLSQYPELAAVLRRMVAMKPSDRYSSAPQVLKDLEHCTAHPQSSRGGTLKPANTSANASAANASAANANAAWQTAPGPSVVRHPSASNPAPNPTPPSTLIEPTLAAVPRAAKSSARANASGTARSAGAVLEKPALQPTKPATTSWGKRLGLASLACLVLGGGGILGLGVWQGLQSPAVDPEPEDTEVQDTPAAPPAPQLPPAERARKQRIWEQRQALGVPETFLNQLVNDDFYAQHPELNGRKLNRYDADKGLRDEWDDLAFSWLDTLTALPKAQRQKLGSYKNEVRDRWITQINKKRLGSRALNDMVAVQVRQVFPELSLSAQTSGPQAQLWRTIAAETVKSILDGTSLTKLKLNDGQAFHTSSVEAHRGIAHVIELKQGQMLSLSLESNSPLDLAFYPPRSNQAALVPLSGINTWEGSLDTDGFYEVVLVASNAATDYTLNLVVTDPALDLPETDDLGGENPDTNRPDTENPAPQDTEPDNSDNGDSGSGNVETPPTDTDAPGNADNNDEDPTSTTPDNNGVPAVDNGLQQSLEPLEADSAEPGQ